MNVTGAPVSEWLPALLLGLVAVAVFVGLVTTLLFRLTAGLVKAADVFIAALKAHDYTAARACLSDEFRARYDAAALRALVASLGLSEVRQASWISRRLVNGHGYLHGCIGTAQGSTVFVWIVLVKRRGAWAIHALRKPGRGPLGYLPPFTSHPQEPPP